MQNRPGILHPVTLPFVLIIDKEMLYIFTRSCTSQMGCASGGALDDEKLFLDRMCICNTTCADKARGKVIQSATEIFKGILGLGIKLVQVSSKVSGGLSGRASVPASTGLSEIETVIVQSSCKPGAVDSPVDGIELAAQVYDLLGGCECLVVVGELI